MLMLMRPAQDLQSHSELWDQGTAEEGSICGQGLDLKPQGAGGLPGHTEDKQDAPTSPATSLQRQESGNPRMKSLRKTTSQEGGHRTGSRNLLVLPARAGSHFRGKGMGYTQSSNMRTVPSGLSFSRNHFLKRKERGKINFCYYLSETQDPCDIGAYICISL